MLSLGNAFDADELKEWHTRTLEMLETDTFEMVCELKYDGLAVALTYERGELTRGATRGNGVGRRGRYRQFADDRERPAAKLLWATRQNLPDVLEVRGEVYFPKSEFKKFNAKRERRKGYPPTSTRATPPQDRSARKTRL